MFFTMYMYFLKKFTMTKSECHFNFFAIFETITTTKSSANFRSPESNEQGFLNTRFRLKSKSSLYKILDIWPYEKLIKDIFLQWKGYQIPTYYLKECFSVLVLRTRAVFYVFLWTMGCNIFCSNILDFMNIHMNENMESHKNFCANLHKTWSLCNTVKLGNKERFDKEQIGIKEPFPVTNLPFTS